MPLTQDERAWFDERFDRIFDVIDRNRVVVEARMNEHSTKINAVSVVSIKAVSEHEKEHHDPVKRAGFLGTLIAIGLGIVEGFRWLFGMSGGKGP